MVESSPEALEIVRQVADVAAALFPGRDDMKNDRYDFVQAAGQRSITSWPSGSVQQSSRNHQGRSRGCL